MDTPRFTVRQACKAAEINRTTLGQWVTREFFYPEEPAVSGKGRTFSFEEVGALVVLAELSRLGVSLQDASRCVYVSPFGGKRHTRLDMFRDEPSLFVVWQGPQEMIPISERGAPGHRPKRLGEPRPAAPAFYDPDRPILNGESVRLSELASVAADPDVRSMAVLNLDHIERRVMAALEADEEGDD